MDEEEADEVLEVNRCTRLKGLAGDFFFGSISESLEVRADVAVDSDAESE